MRPKSQRLLLDPMPVKVSAAMARQIFHGCEVGYIQTTCHAACCKPGKGPLVVVEEDEARAIAAALRTPVGQGLLPLRDDHSCPFQAGDYLCGAHGTGLKPVACIDSPFTLNTNDTLIVRNRYRMLSCYRDGTLPAYQAFGASLVSLFGADEAARITAHLDAGGGDLIAYMALVTYVRVKAKDRVLTNRKESGK